MTLSIMTFIMIGLPMALNTNDSQHNYTTQNEMKLCCVTMLSVVFFIAMMSVVLPRLSLSEILKNRTFVRISTNFIRPNFQLRLFDTFGNFQKDNFD